MATKATLAEGLAIVKPLYVEAAKSGGSLYSVYSKYGTLDPQLEGITLSQSGAWGLVNALRRETQCDSTGTQLKNPPPIEYFFRCRRVRKLKA